MSRAALLVPITLAVVPLAVVVGGCNSEPGPFDTADFAAEIDDVLDDALDADTDVADIRCPIDDWETLVEDSVAMLDDDVVRAALRADEDTIATESAGEKYIDCSFYDFDDRVGVGLFFLETPRDLDEFAQELGGDDARLDIDETTMHRGGQFRHVCAENQDDESYSYCQVEWNDDDVLIGIYVLGEDADRIDTDLLEEGFRPQLDVVMAQFAE